MPTTPSLYLEVRHSIRSYGVYKWSIAGKSNGYRNECYQLDLGIYNFAFTRFCRFCC